MRLSNTTGSDDTLIENARNGPALSDLIEIIERLDTALSHERDLVEALEAEVSNLKDEPKDAQNRPVE